MADTLSNLQQDAQSIQANTGVKPTNSATAISMGASPDSAKMIGSSANQAAAIKESVAPKSTLSYLQRTAGARTTIREGQSKEAQDKLDAARQLAGIAGKVGAATTAAVQEAVLPPDVKADISMARKADGTVFSETEQTQLSNDLASLVTAFNSPDAQTQLDAYANIKKKYGLNDAAIASMFKVNPEALQAKISASLGKVKIKVSDMLTKGYIDQKQVDAAKAVLLPQDVEGFENLQWAEAKVKMDAAIDAAQTNTNTLMKQASDLTLPPSTRAIALQRLKELGMSGEMQAAAGLEDISKDIEAADNVKIGDKTFEVNEVLNSPEAADAIKKVLETGDVSSLDGTPFEGLKELITTHGKQLADKFGIKWDGSVGAGKLQQTEALRKSNETAINDYLKSVGVIAPSGNIKEILKSLGVTDDVLNGYKPFDSNTLAGNRIIAKLADPKMSEADKSEVWNTLGYPGISSLLSGNNSGLESMLYTKEGRTTLQQLSTATGFVGKAEYTDNKNVAAEVKEMLSTFGFNLDDYPANFNFGSYGVKLPDFLDSDNNGRIDDAATLQKTMVAHGANLEEMKAFKEQLAAAPNNLKDAIQTDSVITKAIEAGKVAAPEGYHPYYIDETTLVREMENLKPYLSSQHSSVRTAAQAAYNGLESKQTAYKNEKQRDTQRTKEVTAALTLGLAWDSNLTANEAKRINMAVTGLDSQNPDIKAKAVEAIRIAFSNLIEGYTRHPARHINQGAQAQQLASNEALLRALRNAGYGSLVDSIVTVFKPQPVAQHAVKVTNPKTGKTQIMVGDEG